MLGPIPIAGCPLFVRLLGLISLFVILSVPEPCSAAEVTFGPGSKYSVQLPDTWTAKVQQDKTLGANGPGRLTLNAFVGSTETTPEALMEKIIAGSTSKKAGYKLIEKGTVKNKEGRTAHLHRYQLDAKSGTETWVDYYFQLAEKEVVILVFAFPSDAPKTVRGEIEAILNSVKVVTAASQDDSWLTTPEEKSSTAPPGATGPKASATLVTFATNCSVELPAGWTGKASGKHIEATGPGGMRLDGFSEKSPMSVDLALAVHHSVLEKMPGYELVDTDEISTKAGAKGKLSYYRYNGKNGPVAEVAVIVEVAKNQIATLRFLTPSASRKLDATFQNEVEAIFSSLKISQ